MKKISIFLTIAFFLLNVVSCTNHDDSLAVNINKPIDLRTENGNISLETLSDDLQTYWECALDYYSLEVICACDCNGMFAVANICNNCRSGISCLQDLTGISISDCNELQEAYFTVCNYNTPQSAWEDLYNTLDTLRILEDSIRIVSAQELELIKNIVSDMFNSQFDVVEARGKWYALPSNSSTNNNFSAIIIETANSLLVFNKDNPTVFDDDDGTIVPYKIASIIGGAVGSVLYDCIRDVYFDTGYCDDGLGDLWDSACKGAIMGAVR